MIDDLGERLLFASFAKHQIKETESDHLDNRSVKNNQKENTMKKMALPLSRLSSDQKQDLMETVWKALAGDEKILESPAWHGSILQDRKRAYAMDKMTTADRGKAKKRMKKALRCRFLHDQRDRTMMTRSKLNSGQKGIIWI